MSSRSASIHTFRPRLVDGPVVEVNRADRVAQMAKTLIELSTYADKDDAILSVRGKFSAVEIMMMIDDARQVAMQHVVAREMSAR